MSEGGCSPGQRERQQAVHSHELSNVTPRNVSQGNDRIMVFEQILLDIFIALTLCQALL